MKKLITMLLVLLLITGLCGCRFGSSLAENPVNFYYPWADLEAVMKQNPHCTVTGSEEHDISGNRDSLSYVLSLYFLGPQDPGLISPFPHGTAVQSIEQGDTQLILTLSPAFAQLNGIDLTIACTCLAQTCFDLTDAESVRIESAMEDPLTAVNFTITRENLLLSDTSPEPITSAE